ncbi:glycosyltransferase [Nicoliella spurrieriana]|uniref:Glycosyltransferase n=1 Tax=Nicoliella spurrieriana TaxID=2925830 RepID=A0A976RS59_9LACO|nr:glycosyltransferase [Nicoliella spurrieriana]UQS86868.1 glycosyltransferase [Nicoliella spurrieriana]
MNWLGLLTFSLICYPILGAIYISFGIIWYEYLCSSKITHFNNYPVVSNEPLVSIIISAHNEHSTLTPTIEYLENRLCYRHYEVLIMDDGSTDDTLDIAKRLQAQYQNLRVVHISNNNGKAHALNVGIGFANGEFILSNDSDTLPEPNAINKYLTYFTGIKNRNVGAVTANMDVNNRTTLIAKSQIIEFTSIVGGIKRTQTAVSGSMYAFSGANTMYRRDALIDVGGFRQNRATEDISIAWDMAYYQWQTKFSPDIVFHMLVPEDIPSLYHQRKRWSQGGTEVWLYNFRRMVCSPIGMHRQLPIYVDNTLSILWSFALFIATVVLVIMNIDFLLTHQYARLLNLWTVNMALVAIEYLMGFVQLILSLNYDQFGMKMRYLWVAPLYISCLWLVNTVSLVMTFILACKTIFFGHSSGTWQSPR